MAITLDQISSQIVAALRVSDPDLDTSVGTTTRKIIDAVAEQISEAYIDNHVTTYQYDIDAKTDADLDAFVQMFGMARLAAKQSSGLLTFFRTDNLSAALSIPVGTTVSTTDSTPVVIQTVATAVMAAGVTTVSIPAQAVVPSSAGNVAANSLTVTLAAGIKSVSNVVAFTGGSDQESDAQLRARWKATVFRSLAGTQQMYQGIATDDPDCYAANVVGAVETWREQLQVPNPLTLPVTLSTSLQHATYVYSTPVLAADSLDTPVTNLYVPGIDYTLNSGVTPPTITLPSGSSIAAGDLLDVSISYQSSGSRNDVANNITNRVDIWCGGQRAINATATVVLRTANTFSSSSASPLYNQKFVGLNDVAPSVGNIFLQLPYGPILSVPETLTISGTTYGLADYNNPFGTIVGTSPNQIYYGYRVVHFNAPNGYSPDSLFGLEFYTGNYSDSATHIPGDATEITVSGDQGYTYNAMVSSINNQIQNWRLLGVDAKAHQAKTVQILLNLAVVYSQGYSVDVVQSAMYGAINQLFTQIGFNGYIRTSDILQTIQALAGVKAVRFLNGTDWSTWNPSTPNNFSVGIQKVIGDTYNSTTGLFTPVIGASYVDTNGRAVDFVLNDYELPQIYGINVVAKAQNSFGVA